MDDRFVYNVALSKGEMDIIMNAIEIAWNTYRDQGVDVGVMKSLETIIDHLEHIRQKKFYLKHNWIKSFNGLDKSLMINDITDMADLKSVRSLIGCKNQFTFKEIEQIMKRYKTDLPDFEFVEVEE